MVHSVSLLMFYLIPRLTNAWCNSNSNGWTTNINTKTQTRMQRSTIICKANTNNNDDDNDNYGSRRNLLKKTVTSLVTTTTLTIISGSASADSQEMMNDKQKYYQNFPTLFAPLYGEATQKRTIRRSIGPNIWSLEQNLELGPLQTPLRCVVIRLDNGSLWVHAPLAPTLEFFELVESCCCDDNSNSGETEAVVAHIIVPTYALEHKIFVKDAIQRWPNAQLWTSPGQFTFPFDVSEEFVFGKKVSGILSGGSGNLSSSLFPCPWINEIEYETLASGTFTIGMSPTTFYETAFFHKKSKSLIVTDSVVRIPKNVPELNDADKLLLISKRSTSDPMPIDTPESRLIGWEKTSLLVSYFFPEHEEPDPTKFGVVTWTDGWHDNFNFLSNQLVVVPPVVRTLIYAQNPTRVQEWVDRVTDGKWDFEQIIPAHFDAPIPAKPKDLANAFRFLKDDTIDAFPYNDLARGLKPIANLATKK